MSNWCEELSPHRLIEFLKLNDTSDVCAHCNDLGSLIYSLSLDLDVASGIFRFEDSLQLAAVIINLLVQEIVPQIYDLVWIVTLNLALLTRFKVKMIIFWIFAEMWYLLLHQKVAEPLLKRSNLFRTLYQFLHLFVGKLDRFWL